MLGGAAAILLVGLVDGICEWARNSSRRLSEGDIVIGIMRSPGTDLAESTRINTRMEQILLKEFPDEVSHVWSRNGAPEVATDASDVQTTDLFVSLAPSLPVESWPARRENSSG